MKIIQIYNTEQPQGKEDCRFLNFCKICQTEKDSYKFG